jgi:predicted PP-loop superfamily ATPase
MNCVNLCIRCVLPESFPGITLDGEGVCSICRTWEQGEMKRQEEIRQCREQFQRLAESTKEARSRAGGTYDLLMAYSGGKDSTFALKVLRKRFGLTVLALTFNNGFLSPRARDNILKVTSSLDVDHLMISPDHDILRRAFAASITSHRYPRKALERASPICHTCMSMVKGAVLLTAIEKGIPLLGYGWSPGQVPLPSSILKMNLPLLRQTQDALRAGLGAVMGSEAEAFLLQDRHYHILEKASAVYGGKFLYHVNPLVFLPYDENCILEEIAALGWKAPGDTDSNSTNCLLNALAIQVHQENYGFHPYSAEVAGLVRGGHMTRDEGLAKLYTTPDPGMVADIRRLLGLPCNRNDGDDD